MSEQVPSKEQFRRTDELHGRVIDARVVAMYSPELIEIDDHGNRIGIEDARALRDWLNKALPESPHEPPPEQSRPCGLCNGLGCRMCDMTGKYIPDDLTGPFACESCNRLAREAHTWSKALEETIKRQGASQPPAAEYKIGDRVNHCGHITEVVGVSVKYMLCGGAVVYGHDLQLYSTATKEGGQ